MAVGGGRAPVGGLPTPGATDPRLIGLLMLEGGRWLAMNPETNRNIINMCFSLSRSLPQGCHS